MKEHYYLHCIHDITQYTFKWSFIKAYKYTAFKNTLVTMVLIQVINLTIIEIMGSRLYGGRLYGGGLYGGTLTNWDISYGLWPSIKFIYFYFFNI